MMSLTHKVKQKMKKQEISLFKSVLALGMTMIVAGVLIVSPLVRADSFDDQIRAINNDTAAKNQVKTQLGTEAASLQDVINKLQAEINALQVQINENQAKSADLQKQIVAAEEELAKQKKLLGENIRAMYLEGQITTLEMLASSRDLSEFVDKQQYRDSVKDKIKNTLDRVTALKAQLKTQKELVEKLLADQQAMHAQVAAQQGEQNRLLSLNQGQQAELNQQIKNNNAQIAELRAQQAAANRRLGGNIEAGDPGRGGYPAYLDRAPQDSLIDPWGMYNRECVSYTAWKVYQAYGHMPYWGGHGNANQWPASARADGIPTGSTPKAGSVAVSMAGYYGHVMWVEYVLPNGYIHVSQYNYDWNGRYSEMTINGAGLTYIYFE